MKMLLIITMGSVHYNKYTLEVLEASPVLAFIRQDKNFL